MTSSSPVLATPQKTLNWKRRLRRFSVRVRTSPFSIPMLLLLVYAGLMVGLTRVADSWIVALAITPLIFALLLSLGCLLAYRRGLLRMSPGLASLLLPIDAFDTSTHQVMGRRVAGAALPRVWPHHSNQASNSACSRAAGALPALRPCCNRRFSQAPKSDTSEISIRH